jgi:hypothetical protein
MAQINLGSKEYQAAYYAATKAAALTGDDVYEIKTNTNTSFATGQGLIKIIGKQICDFKVINSLYKII